MRQASSRYETGLFAVQGLRLLVRRGRGVLGGASTEPCDPGLVRRGAGRRTRCAERAVMAHSSPGPAAAGSEGTRRVGWREYGASRSRACSEGGLQAHSVRRESCDGSQQSRACGCWFGGGRERRGACRRTPCAERAVMAHSSPEPAAACSERGWFGGGAGAGEAGIAREGEMGDWGGDE